MTAATTAAAGARIVDGATRLYCIVGDPIAQVGSPHMFTTRFRALGRNALLVPFHVPGDAFDTVLAGIKALRNLDGIIATVPYKIRIMAHADAVLTTGRQVGAINALRRDPDGRWTGDMFDGRGLVRGLALRGHAVAGRRVLLLGAGGAGSALACALAEAGAVAVTLYDLDQAKAQALAARVAAAFPACAVAVGRPAMAGHDMLVNATTVGMAPQDGLPAPLGPLTPGTLVADVIVKHELTPLRRHAEACGCPHVGGYTMMEGQVDEMLRFFGFEVPEPR
jgi:shikimate dehydrogenase